MSNIDTLLFLTFPPLGFNPAGVGKLDKSLRTLCAAPWVTSTFVGAGVAGSGDGSCLGSAFCLLALLSSIIFLHL